MSSTEKASRHSVPTFSSSEADAAVAGAGAAVVVAAAEAEADAAAAEAVVAAVVVAAVAFGSMAAAEAAWCVRDARLVGAFRHRRLPISIRRRQLGRRSHD